MKLTPKSKKYLALSIVLIIINYVIILIYTGNKEKESHIDNREIVCNGKTLPSVEYNVDKKECFQTDISACLTPTYSTIYECMKLNGIKTEEDSENNSNEIIENSEIKDIENEAEENQLNNDNNIIETESNNSGTTEDKTEENLLDNDNNIIKTESNNSGTTEDKTEENLLDNDNNIIETESNNSGTTEDKTEENLLDNDNNIIETESNNSGTIKEEKDSNEDLKEFFNKL